MKLIVSMLLLNQLAQSFKMGTLITCLEQNVETPYGFKEKDTWGNALSIECDEYPDLCKIYAEQEPFAGEGDVCDHTDPISATTRNACKFAVMFGEEIDEERTWSWKCAELSQCPLPGRVGCLITDKRIMCCCQDDFCTSDPLYAQYAAWGRPDHWPPNYEEILAIDSGDIVVEVDIPGYGSVESSDESYESHESEQQSPESQESGPNYNYDDARLYLYAKQGREKVIEHPAFVSNNNGEIISVAQILLIFTYFIVGIFCMGTGVFIGSKWGNSVVQKQQVKNEFGDL